MSLLTIPNTFITGLATNAPTMNANFVAVQTAVNNIDNTNIGSAGIYASQIIPTSAAQAMFGGSFGYTFGILTNPITIGIVSSNATQAIKIYNNVSFIDIFSVPSNSINGVACYFGVDYNNVTNLLALDSTGNLSVAGAMAVTTAAVTTSSGVSYGGTTASSATAGASGAVPSQVVGYIIVNVNGTNRKVPYFAT